MGARVKMPKELSELLRSDLERAIYEAALNADDALIAKRYLVEKVAQIDVAAELGWERSTVSRRLPGIVERVAWAANRLKIT
mgnify:CR=1 FL=1